MFSAYLDDTDGYVSEKSNNISFLLLWLANVSSRGLWFLS